MRNAVIGLSLTVAFLLGIIASNVAGSPARAADEAAATQPAPVAPAPRWEAICVGTEKAGVDQHWTNEDLDKPDGWNKAMARYTAQGWEPFEMVSIAAGNGKLGAIAAVCFRRQR
jgi:hypothetical protein